MLKKLVIIMMLSHQIFGMEKEDSCGVVGNVGNWTNTKTVEFPEDFQGKVNKLCELYNKQKLKLESLKNGTNELKEENRQLKQQVAILEQRISTLEKGSFTKIKKIISSPFNYYSFLGTSALLNSLFVCAGIGFVKFQYKNLGVIAACGYGASLFGVGLTKALSIGVDKPDIYFDWLLPTTSGIVIGFFASILLDKIDITPKGDIYWGTCYTTLVTTGFLSSATMHYIYITRGYGDSK